MYCNQCGNPNADNAHFCSYCGQPIEHITTQKPTNTTTCIEPSTYNQTPNYPQQAVPPVQNAATISLLSNLASTAWQIPMYITYGLYAICAILLMCKWISLDAFITTIDLSMYDYIIDYPEIRSTALGIIIIVATVIFIISLIASIYCFIKQSRSVFDFSLVLSFALIAFSALIIIVHNSVDMLDDLDSLLYGYLVTLKAPPYILLVLAIISVVAVFIAKNRYDADFSQTISDDEKSNSTPVTESLSINNRSGINIETITKQKHLKELTIASSDISNISFLADMTQLEFLDLSDNNITNIDVLSVLSGLSELYLSDNDINDISALSNLCNLTYLGLDRTAVADLTPLHILHNLRSLSIEDCNISAEQIKLLRNVNPKLIISR